MTSIKKEKIYRSLQEQIITQKLPAGTRINEKELMEEYNIGRTPLRDIFLQLKLECLIETIPQSGTFVKELKKIDIQETLEMRIPLEIIAAKFVPVRITKEQLNEINFKLYSVKKDLKKLTLFEFKNATDQIHNLYYDAVGNKRLSETLKTLHNISARAWFSEGYEMRATEDTLNDWEKRIEMIENNDTEALQKEVKTHVLNFANSLDIDEIIV